MTDEELAEKIYNSMRTHARKDNVAQYVPGVKSSKFPRMSTFYAEWTNLFPHEKALFVAVAQDLKREVNGDTI